MLKEIHFDIDAAEFAEAKRSLNGMMQTVLCAIMAGRTDEGKVVFTVDISNKDDAPETKYKCVASYNQKANIDGNIHFKGMMTLTKGYDGGTEVVGLMDAPEQMEMDMEPEKDDG